VWLDGEMMVCCLSLRPSPGLMSFRACRSPTTIGPPGSTSLDDDEEVALMRTGATCWALAKGPDGGEGGSTDDVYPGHCQSPSRVAILPIPSRHPRSREEATTARDGWSSAYGRARHGWGWRCSDQSLRQLHLL
jgi:hypothetical protein